MSPNACNNQDLIVVVPWVLSNVLSGKPIIFYPYIELAKYVAEYRNYWWQHIRYARSDTTIIHPENPAPYPNARDSMSDHPVSDSGNNFGRIARVRMMDDYVSQFNAKNLLGKDISQWRNFFKDK